MEKAWVRESEAVRGPMRAIAMSGSETKGEEKMDSDKNRTVRAMMDAEKRVREVRASLFRSEFDCAFGEIGEPWRGLYVTLRVNEISRSEARSVITKAKGQP